MKSISFDRAANIYEQTRGFPPGIGEQVAQAALEIVGPAATVVEVGVGTGRISRPLAALGVEIFGLDLSRQMMAELVRRAAGPMPTLVQGDATRLPFAPQQFDAVLSVHVFHLIPQWPEALSEVRRVLKPSGIFLTGYDWRPTDTPSGRMLEKWREIVSARGFFGEHPGARDFAEVKQFLVNSGATYTERFVGNWQVTRTVAHALETIEHRTWSATWHVPDDFFPHCLAELRAWAAQELGPLETTFTVPHKFCWQAFRWS